MYKCQINISQVFKNLENTQRWHCNKLWTGIQKATDHLKPYLFMQWSLPSQALPPQFLRFKNTTSFENIILCPVMNLPLKTNKN